jgi:hypothetical protein
MELISIEVPVPSRRTAQREPGMTSCSREAVKVNPCAGAGRTTAASTTARERRLRKRFRISRPFVEKSRPVLRR